MKSHSVDTSIQITLGRALDDPSQSSPEFAASAIEWAQSAAANPKATDTNEDWMREQSIFTAAMIAIRDGDAELRTQHTGWVRSIFSQALQTEEDPAQRFRPGLRYNPIAISFAGMIYGLKDRANTQDFRALLEVAARDNPAAAQGFGAAFTTLAGIDERLPRAILRCAFAARILPNRKWDLPEEEIAARAASRQERILETINRELKWLDHGCPEPDWPPFPLVSVRRRRRLRLPGGNEIQEPTMEKNRPPDEHVDQQGAALWLSNVRPFDVSERPLLRDIVLTYSHWTTTANGAELDKNEEVTNAPREWNDVYFDLQARCLPELPLSEIDQFVLASICSLPDEPFFDVVTSFLSSVDVVYFSDLGLKETVVVNIRSTLANRLMESSGWKRLQSSRSASIEMHIGPAIAVLFFNNHGFTQPARCYLRPKDVDRLEPFFPVLEKLVKSGPSLFVAILTLNLLKVSTHTAHFSFFVAAVEAWLEHYPDDTDFWIDNGIGRRVCASIENFRLLNTASFEPENALRVDVDRMLSALVQLGIADARRLEQALAEGSGKET
jgi:hypothetical protein